MEPAPLVTFAMRGVFVELDSKGANVSTMTAGPMALVVKAAVRPAKREAPASSLLLLEIAALFTRASRLCGCQLILRT